MGRSVRPDSSLSIGRGDAVVFCDERLRTDVDTTGRPFSVTLDDGGDTSWGEFLSLEDVALLHAWTGEMLRRAAFERD